MAELKKSTTVPTPHIHAPFTMELSNMFVNLVFLIQNSGACFVSELREDLDSDTQKIFEYCFDIA